jgi:branched-chain amino acid transport system permease protein
MRATLGVFWDRLMEQRWLLPLLMAVGLALAFAIPQFRLVNNYVQLVMILAGINIILATSLNLVNGYMGEFSLAHAGFMAVGAYTSVLLTLHVFPVAAYPGLFHLAVLAGGSSPRSWGYWSRSPPLRCAAIISPSLRWPS